MLLLLPTQPYYASNSASLKQLANLTGFLLSTISQTRSSSFSFADHTFHIKAENNLSFSYESSLQLIVIISNNKLKLWTENVCTHLVHYPL